jgi:predicted transposase/invertase (TIGR01784 family)
MEETFKKLEFTDDFMFRKVMENKKICTRMLEILLDIKIDHVENLTPEFTLESLIDKRGVRLDVYVKDSNRVFDVEMQTIIKGDEGLRARYYQSEIDMKILNRRESYRKLKESYVIFLCTQDPFGFELPVYVFENLCRGNNSIKLDDRTFKYFFNASAAEKIQGNEEVKKLLTYISTHVPENAFTQEIEEEVEASSNDAEWRKGLMTFEMLMEEKKKEAREQGREEGIAEGMEKGIAQGMEKGIEKGREEGLEQGAYNKSLETAKTALSMNLPPENISKLTGLPLETILKLKDQL